MRSINVAYYKGVFKKNGGLCFSEKREKNVDSHLDGTTLPIFLKKTKKTYSLVNRV